MESSDSPAPNSQPDPAEVIRRDCLKRAVEAFGTASVFEWRSHRLTWHLQLITFAGLVVPVVVGLLALSYGAGFKALPLIIIIGSALGTAQVIFSLWSLVARWVEAQGYAVESMISNRRLFGQYVKTARDLTLDLGELKLRYESLVAEDTSRREQDTKWNLKAKERRKGLRAGLRELGIPCTACKETPVAMTATKCDLCGNF
ncbi:mobilome CxxCx(11)CxxC protein [Amycolatopsis sp. NPDC098790]|uniref:mobilome CxxCx(11)CxxC protein n=1 Tax=Amycolatopsis sp. NPDC098790 TaxID=3363939 RepID=UPI003826A222